MNSRKLVCAYARLSQEDIDKEEDYSASIYNQLAFIKSYAKTMGFEIDKEYIDDGYSGINFNRPGFEKLKEDIQKGYVEIVITKDMSRLGREFIETMYYVSDFFPRNKVRYIAINDQYDSESNDCGEQETILTFKSLINDRYVKDSSIKRKQIAEAKTNNKEFIGFIAPYGYRIVKKDNKRTLEIDEYAASIVKRIFTEVACGKTRKEVADGLNNDKIIPPVIYMNMTPSRNKKYYYDWSDIVVYRILKNKTYTGRIVARKSTKNNYRQDKRDVIRIKDRQTIDDCHPVIISDALFEEANSKLKTMPKLEKNDYSGLFTGLVVCGVCGRTMTSCRRKRENGNIKYHFECTAVVERVPCPNRTIADSKLKSIVSETLYDLINNYVDKDELALISVKNTMSKERLNTKISKINDEIEIHKKNIRNLYLQKARGEITLEQFVDLKQNETFTIESLEKTLKETIESKNVDSRTEELIEKYNHFIDSDELMNKSLRDLIDKIVIYKDNTIKIEFKFGLGEPKKIKLF